MLRIEPGFVPPDYVRDVRYVPRMPLCTCAVDAARVDELRAHPGVVALSLPRVSHVVLVPRDE